MRLTLLTLGTRGDVEPMIALGGGLARRGHDVRLATHDGYAGLATSHGLEFRTLASDAARIMREIAPPGAEQEGTIARFRHVGKVMSQMMHEALANVRACCDGSDAILANPIVLFTGADAMSADSRPVFLTLLQPGLKSRKVESVLAPEWPLGNLPGRALYNELTYSTTDMALWALMRRTVNAARAGALGLPPLRESPIGAHQRRGGSTLVGVSTHVVAPPEEAPPSYHMTGYWFLPPDREATPSPALEAFLAAGPPPLCVGFGSAGGKEVAEGYRRIVDMARRHRRRTVLLTGWGQLEGCELPDHVLAVREAPHEWLLPRVSAFVHHGGAGTTAAALRAGVPMVILPYGADARFWARRAHEIGVSPRPIGLGVPWRRVEEAIGEALGDPRLRTAARAIAGRIDREDGVRRAVEVVEATLTGRAGAQNLMPLPNTPEFQTPDLCQRETARPTRI